MAGSMWSHVFAEPGSPRERRHLCKQSKRHDVFSDMHWGGTVPPMVALMDRNNEGSVCPAASHLPSYGTHCCPPAGFSVEEGACPLTRVCRGQQCLIGGDPRSREIQSDSQKP